MPPQQSSPFDRFGRTLDRALSEDDPLERVRLYRDCMQDLQDVYDLELIEAHDRDGCSLSALARALGITRQSLTDQLDNARARRQRQHMARQFEHTRARKNRSSS